MQETVEDYEVDKGVVKAWDEKPLSTQNGGRVNAAFDKLNDDEVAISSVVNNDSKSHKTENRENVPASSEDTETAQKAKGEPPKAVGVLELVRCMFCSLHRGSKYDIGCWQ
jgi:hypothetical protein